MNNPMKRFQVLNVYSLLFHITVILQMTLNLLSHTAAKFGQLLTELLLSPWLGKEKYCLIYENGVWQIRTSSEPKNLYKDPNILWDIKMEDWSGWTTWLEWRISDYQRFWMPSWIKSEKLVDLNKDGLMVSKLI